MQLRSTKNVDRDLALIEARRKAAEARGASVAQVAIAWVAPQGREIVPLVGARPPRSAGRSAPARST
jgi:aryl-alcohol dehydrogenase-like predicted oxidoreductase